MHGRVPIQPPPSSRLMTMSKLLGSEQCESFAPVFMCNRQHIRVLRLVDGGCDRADLRGQHSSSMGWALPARRFGVSHT